MARRGFMFGALWAFVALAFVGGLVVGAVLPLWQRAALQNDVRVLEKRLNEKEQALGVAQEETDDLREKLASVEASTQELAQLNSELASEVASLRAAQTAAPPSTQQSTGNTGSASKGGITIVEHSVSPSTSPAGGSVQLTVKVRGDADRVTMRIDGPKGSTYDYTYGLRKVATEGDTTIWRSVLKAPSGAGQYRCIAAARRGSASVTTGAIPLIIN